MRQFSLYQAAQSENAAATTYHGLETMRLVSSFGVVLLHVCSVTGVPVSLERLVKFRDFALPVMVMSSFFVLTLSLARRPAGDFGRFFNRRFGRLVLPLAVWTVLYVLFTIFLIPLWMGAAPAIETFSPIVFLSGYRHLWYLQFVFIGSMILYPVMARISNSRRFSRSGLLMCCLGGALFYGACYQAGVRDLIWRSLGDEPDVNLQIFAVQASRYAFYIPLAVGLGLVSGYLEKLFKNALFCRISLLLALVGMLLHVGSSSIPVSQEIYAIAVFLAALQPWKKIPFECWRKIVDYSYGIYIVHFFWIHLLWLYLANYNREMNGSNVLCAAMVVYFSSLGTALLIRKILPFDWLLPPIYPKPPESSRIDILELFPAGEKQG